MKKLLIGLLTVLTLLSVCACESKPTESAAPEDQLSGSSVLSNTSSAQMQEQVYNSTEAFDYSEVDDGVIITYFKNYDYVEYDKIVIPESINGKPVVGIGALEETDTYYGKVFSAVFGNCEVVIPNTVTYIGGKAFHDAKGLTKLSGGENCTRIGEYAFMNCTNLSEITFIDNVTDLADDAFAGCTKWISIHSEFQSNIS